MTFMKKRYRYLAIFVPLFFILALFLLLSINLAKIKQQHDLLQYLDKRYVSHFEIIDTVPSKTIDESVIFAYRIKDHNDIEFVAGKKREKMLFPLIPGGIQSTFFDNYDEKIKKFDE